MATKPFAITPPSVTVTGSGKGATAILVGLVAFTAYLYLSGKLTAVSQALAGTSSPTLGGSSGPLQPVPIDTSNIPVTGGQPATYGERFSFSVKHKVTGQQVKLTAISGPGCKLDITTLLLSGAGYNYPEASSLADRICADVKSHSAQPHKPGATFTVLK